MSKTTNKYAPKVREGAVHMVLENQGEHGSRWAAVVSIAAKIGGSAQTLDEWLKKAEVNWTCNGFAPVTYLTPFKLCCRSNSTGDSIPFRTRLRTGL